MYTRQTESVLSDVLEHCEMFEPLPSCFRYMVDAADPEKIEASKNELHNLLDKPQLQGIPVRTAAQR